MYPPIGRSLLNLPIKKSGSRYDELKQNTSALWDTTSLPPVELGDWRATEAIAEPEGRVSVTPPVQRPQDILSAVKGYRLTKVFVPKSLPGQERISTKPEEPVGQTSASRFMEAPADAAWQAIHNRGGVFRQISGFEQVANKFATEKKIAQGGNVIEARSLETQKVPVRFSINIPVGKTATMQDVRNAIYQGANFDPRIVAEIEKATGAPFLQWTPDQERQIEATVNFHRKPVTKTVAEAKVYKGQLYRYSSQTNIPQSAFAVYEAYLRGGPEAAKIAYEHIKRSVESLPAPREATAEERAAAIETYKPSEYGVVEAARQFGQSFLKQGLAVPEGVAGIVESFLPGEGRLTRAVRPFTEATQGLVERLMPVDPTNKSWRTAKIPQAFGSAASFIAGGGLLRSPKVASALLGAATNVQQFGKEYDAATGVKGSRRLGTLMAAATGALEAFGIEGRVGQFGTRSRFLEAVKSGTLGEATQESFNDLMNDLNAVYVSKHDRNRDIGEGMLESFALGSIVGTGFEGLSFLSSKVANRRERAAYAAGIANAEPDSPIARIVQQSGITLETISQADNKAIDELTKRLEVWAWAESQLRRLQYQREQLATQVQEAEVKLQTGRVPTGPELQVGEQLANIDQQIAQIQTAQDQVVAEIDEKVSPFFQRLRDQQQAASEEQQAASEERKATSTGAEAVSAPIEEEGSAFQRRLIEAIAASQPQTETLTDAADEEAADLLRAIRREGGMNPEAGGGVLAGDLARLTQKEAGTTGLVSRRGLSVDEMRQRMVEAGLSKAETEGEFLSEIEDELTRRKKGRGPSAHETYEDYARGQMTAEEAEQAERFEDLLKNPSHPFTQAYRRLDNPKIPLTRDLIREFAEEADRAGFAPDVIEAWVNDAYARRQQQVEQHPEQGMLYEADLRAADEARRTGRAVRESLLTDEAIEHARRLGETLKDGDIVEDAAGGHWLYFQGALTQYDAETGEAFGNISRVRGPSREGRSYDPERNTLSIIARGRILRADSPEAQASLERIRRMNPHDVLPQQSAQAQSLAELEKQLDEIDRRIDDKRRNQEETTEDWSERRVVERQIEKLTGKKFREYPKQPVPKEPAPPVRPNAIPEWMRHRNIYRMRGDELTKFVQQLREEKARQDALGYANVDRGLWNTTRTLLKAAEEQRTQLKKAGEAVPPINPPRKAAPGERAQRERIAEEARKRAEQKTSQTGQYLTSEQVQAEVEEEGRIRKFRPKAYDEDVTQLSDEQLAKRISDVEKIQAVMADNKETEVYRRRVMYLEKLRAEQQRREASLKESPETLITPEAVKESEVKAQTEKPDEVTHPNPAIDKKPIVSHTQDGRVVVPNPENKGGVSVVKDRSDEPTKHQYSSTQLNLPKSIADQVIAFGLRIPDSDLAEDGRETTPHITIKYGLHGADPKYAREALADERPITVKLGRVSLFDTNPNFDVVKIDVESPDLHRLNKKIGESQPVTDTHPTYQPHVTIAYVKKGRGDKYVGSAFFEGKTVTLDTVTFSGRDGKEVEIPLQTAPKPPTAPDYAAREALGQAATLAAGINRYSREAQKRKSSDTGRQLTPEEVETAHERAQDRARQLKALYDQHPDIEERIDQHLRSTLTPELLQAIKSGEFVGESSPQQEKPLEPEASQKTPAPATQPSASRPRIDVSAIFDEAIAQLKAESASAEATPERLEEVGLFRRFNNKWQWRVSVTGQWLTSSTREGAIEQARKIYKQTPESERITQEERANRAVARDHAIGLAGSERVSRIEERGYRFTFSKASAAEKEEMTGVLGGRVTDELIAKGVTIKPKTERTAKEAATSAVKKTGKGLESTVKAISILFGGSKVSSGFTFDEKTYAKAKPHFQDAYRHFAEAAADVSEAMILFLRSLKDEYGFAIEVLERIKPYITRFVEEQMGLEPAQSAQAETESVKEVRRGDIIEYQGRRWSVAPQSSNTVLLTAVNEEGEITGGPGNFIDFDSYEDFERATGYKPIRPLPAEMRNEAEQNPLFANQILEGQQVTPAQAERAEDELRTPETRTGPGGPEGDRGTVRTDQGTDRGAAETGAGAQRGGRSGGRPTGGRSGRTEPAFAGAGAETEQEAPTTGSGSGRRDQETEAKNLADLVDAVIDPIATADTVVEAMADNLQPEPVEPGARQPTSKPETKPEPEPERPGQRYLLTGASFSFTPDTITAIESGGKMTKFRQNVAAIELMREILAAGRKATVSEQETLALYAGFGGIKEVFNPYLREIQHRDREKWQNAQNELRNLLGKEAYDAASRSTQNAHYTSPRIVQAMWRIAERLGFKGGRVLEPSMGSGNFLGLTPAHLREKTAFTGVELDLTTGEIARLLYPDANIKIQGFEETQIPDNFYDMAIGNVPFGDYRISDPRYDRFHASIHNYFFLKAIDKVRPGGLAMFITSTGTLDAPAAANVRKYLYEKADLVAAFRFPADTFKNALTSVVTDLVILRKRLPNEGPQSYVDDKGAETPEPPDLWVQTEQVRNPDGGNPIQLNSYLAKHREKMLGTFNGRNKMYPGRANVDRTDKFPELLEQAIQSLPENIMSSRSAAQQAEMKEAAKTMKQGGYVIEDGELYRNESGHLIKVKADNKRIQRVEGMLKIRDILNSLTDAEMGRTEENVDDLRKQLNGAYDRFTGRFGYINDKANRDAFEDDPDLPRLMALEDYNPKRKYGKKRPIFFKATIAPIKANAKPTNITDAVLKSISLRGEVILPMIAGDLGITQAEAATELVSKEIAYQTPAGNWELKAQYLSGNIRQKLYEAREAAANDPFFEANVRALEAVMPPDIPYTDIAVQMGAPWIEPRDTAQFVADLFNDDVSNIKIFYDRATGAYHVELAQSSRAEFSAETTTTWGTKAMPFKRLLELALQGRNAKVTKEVPAPTISNPNATRVVVDVEQTQAANTKLEAIRQRFREWIWEDEARRERLTRRYNEMFNSMRAAEYDASFLGEQVPGMSPDWKLRPHQMAAVLRGVTERRGLLAHEVGLGKTLAMIATASELKRLGIAAKPAIAVPKKVLPGFIQTARDAFPLMKLHVIDGSNAIKRQRTMAAVATGDFDLVLMTHEHLNMLKMKPQFEASILQKELDEINAVYAMLITQPDRERSRGTKADNRLLATIRKRRENLAARIKSALNSEQKDDAITFEDTGIDFLFVDEFHKYKSLPVVTALGQIKGVPTGDSKRAINMLMRIRYLQELHKGGGVITATGTPISNSLVEAYIMAKFLQPDVLELAGIESFDAWARNFAAVVSALELDAAGRWKDVSRMSEFKNLPELQTISRVTLDVKTAKETGILQKRPKRIDKVITIPMDDTQKLFMRYLRERADIIKSGAVEESEDNYLVISHDGRHMSGDIRLVLPGMEDRPSKKTQALVENVIRIHKEKPGTTQMIFCDIGVSANGWGFRLYDDIIDRLADAGIPKEKIIDFSKLDTDVKLEAAISRLQTGDAIIAIGHRETMGTGVNAQNKMAAIHQFDTTWKPAMIEQSEARGWRQGNENSDIEILSYVVEGSFDAVMWATVARKQKAISSFMRGEMTSRELTEEDGEVLTYEQIAAVASGDQDYLRKAELEQRVFKLSMMKRAHEADTTARQAAILRIEREIEAKHRLAERYDDWAEWAKGVREREPIYEAPNGKAYTDKAAAAEALTLEIAAAQKINKGKAMTEYLRIGVGKYKGLQIVETGVDNVKVIIPPTKKNPDSDYFYLSVNFENYIGTLMSFDSNLASIAENARAKKIREIDIPSLEQDLANLRQIKDTPFPYEEELAIAQAQLDRVSHRLAAKEKERANAGEPLIAESGLDIRMVGELGRGIRRGLRKKEINPEDVPKILKEGFAQIKKMSLREQERWREYQRKSIEALIDRYGLEEVAMWEMAKSASQAQRAFGDAYAEQQELAATAEAAIQRKIAELQRSPTSPVEISQLREASNLEKDDFDNAIQRLANKGVIALHRHDYPASLSEEQRERLVKIGDNYFVAVTVRESQHAAEGEVLTARDDVSINDVSDPFESFYHAQQIFKQRGKRGVMVYTNDHARVILAAALAEVTGQDYSNVTALNVSRTNLEKAIRLIESEAQNAGEYADEVRRVAGEWRELLTDNPRQNNFTVQDVSRFVQRREVAITSDREKIVKEYKQTSREERFHWSQREIVGGRGFAEVGASWAQSTRGWGKYRRELLSRGYPDKPEILAAEIAAHIAAEKFDQLNIRTEADVEAAYEWLAKYFERIATKYGIKALDKFGSLVTKAREARERAIANVTKEQAGATAKTGGSARGRRGQTGSPGGSGKRVQGGATSGARQSGRGAQSLHPAPDWETPLPSEQGIREIRGVQLPLPGMPNPQNVRGFDEPPPPDTPVGPMPKSQQPLMDVSKKRSLENFRYAIADLWFATKSLVASGDLSAAGRQGLFLSLPPTQWHIAFPAFWRQFSNMKEANYDLFVEKIRSHKFYRDAKAAGLYLAVDDDLSVPLTEREERFASEFAQKIPWVKISERAYKTYLDSLRFHTFLKYKKAIDKQFRDPAERFEGYQAAAEWLNTTTGRGKFRGKFGAFFDKSLPFLNVFLFAPRYIASRVQMLNPLTYARNVRSPHERVVFRRQMSELFQSAALLTSLGVLAHAAGASISFDDEDPDFLKIKFGSTRYDVLAGLQQITRLAMKISRWVHSELTEEDEKILKAVRTDTRDYSMRYLRGKLAPSMGFIVDWLNDWRKVTGERYEPGQFIESYEEGDYPKVAADIANDPIISMALPLFAADLVVAWYNGYRNMGDTSEAGWRTIKALPAGIGIEVQDYSRPEYARPIRQFLTSLGLEPRYPRKSEYETEKEYEARIPRVIEEQSNIIRKFQTSPLLSYPKDIQREVLSDALTERERERMKTLKPEWIVRDWETKAAIEEWKKEMQNNPVFRRLSLEAKKSAMASFTHRMSKFRAQGGQRPRPPRPFRAETVRKIIAKSLAQ